MGFSWLTTIVILAGLLDLSQQTPVDLQTCFVSDFYGGKVILALPYSSSNLQFAIAENGEAISDYMGLEESGTGSTNYPETCDDFNFCTLHMGVLFDSSLRIRIKDGANMGLLFKQADQTGDPVLCPIDGRNLNVPSTQEGFSIGFTIDDDQQATLGQDISDNSSFVIPLDLDIQKIHTMTNAEGNLIQGVIVTYSDDEKTLFGTGLPGTELEVDVKTVKEVKTRSLNADRSALCGLILLDADGEDVAVFDQCPSADESVYSSFMISADNRLAGFAQYSLGSGFTLIPIEYQRLRPNVLYYERIGNDLSIFAKSFFTTTTTVTVKTTRMNGIELDGSDVTEAVTGPTPVTALSSAPAGSEKVNLVGVGSTCGCFPVTIEITDTADPDADGFQYAQSSPFVAWTVGFTQNDEKQYGSLGNGILDYSGSIYVTQSVPDDGSKSCPEMYPRRVGSGRADKIWVDSWIGSSFADEFIPDLDLTVAITKPITKVSAHVSGIVVTGLTFELSDGSTVTAGDTSNSVPSGGELVADAGHYLMYIGAGISTQAGSIGQITGIKAVFGKPKAPCWVTEVAAEDYTTDLPNADMRKVFFWAPADFTKVHANITGKFVAVETENVGAEIVSMSEFGRGAIYHAYLYHLKPETTYEFTLEGTAQPDVSLTMQSEISPATEFTTGNGLFLQCTNEDPPTYTNRIDWSAVPEVEIRYQDSDLTPLGGTEVNDADAKSSQGFPADTYFHYMDGQTPSLPLFEDFRGYPKNIYLYRANGEQCVKALALEYDFFTGTQKIFLAGDQESATNLPNLDQFEFPSTSQVVAVNYGSTGGCLGSMSFTLESGTTTPCLNGPATVNGCTDTLSSPDSDKFFMSSLNVKTDSDNQITALGVTWASVDFPTLETNEGVCDLEFNEDIFDIRRSHWELTQNLVASPTSCGFVYTTPITGGVHQLVYDQVAKRKSDSSGSIISGVNVGISRSNTWEVTTQCVYNADGLVNSSYSTKGEEGYKVAHLDTIRFSMHMYRDHTFTQKYTVVPTMNLGEEVYISTEMDDDLKNSEIKNFECYATKASGINKNNEYYQLTASNGCPTDTSFQWNDLGDDHKDAFQFSSFGWVDSEGAITVDQVYIHCTVRVCPTDIPEAAALCAARASSCDKRRARRDVSALLPYGVKETTVTMDTPILVRKRDVQELSINRDPIVMTETRSMTVASLFGLFATVTFFCLMVIGYRIHTVRKGYYRLKNEALGHSAN